MLLLHDHLLLFVRPRLSLLVRYLLHLVHYLLQLVHYLLQLVHYLLQLVPLLIYHLRPCEYLQDHVTTCHIFQQALSRPV